MSQENVEAFQRAVEAANRRDVEALLAELDSDVEWHSALPLLGADAVYRGHERVREFLPDVWAAFADIAFEFPDVRDLGDRIVAIGRFRARGEASGVPTETPLAYVIEFANGKAIRVGTYLDPKEALEAAGLKK